MYIQSNQDKIYQAMTLFNASYGMRSQKKYKTKKKEESKQAQLAAADTKEN